MFNKKQFIGLISVLFLVSSLHANVNEVVTDFGLKITIHRLFSVNSTRFPHDRDMYLGLEITIENLNPEESVNISSQDFTLIDEDGRRGDYSIWVSDRIGGVVLSGRKTRGTLVCDVYQRDLYYFYYMLDDPKKRIEWTIGGKPE